MSRKMQRVTYPSEDLWLEWVDKHVCEHNKCKKYMKISMKLVNSLDGFCILPLLFTA